MNMSLSRGSSSSSCSVSGVGGFLVVALRFDGLESVATGGGGDGVAGVAALALPPLFGLAEPHAVETALDCVLLRKGLLIGSAGLSVIGYLGGHLKINTGQDNCSRLETRLTVRDPTVFSALGRCGSSGARGHGWRRL
jgi:hypothetical protein